MSNDLENDSFNPEEESFDDFDSKEGGTTLGKLWRENSMFKIGVIAAGAITVFAGIILYGGGEKPVNPSYVPTGTEMTTPPGTTEASPAYVEAVQEESEQRLEQALMENESALPTPIDTPVGRLPLPDTPQEEEDPLQRWRKLQEERLQREIQRSQSLEPAPVQPDTGKTEAIQALSDTMGEQMQGILDRLNTPPAIGYRGITGPEWLKNLHEQEQREIEEALKKQLPDEDLPPEILFPAGQIAYAQLLLEANSDNPGPVLAQIVSGPLTGGRALGSFEVQQDLLTLTFDTLIIDDVSYGINAIAVDPNTTLTAMATDVDHRYLKRILLPMAAAFVEGAASAISESGLTTVTIEGDVVAEDRGDADSRQEIASGIEEAGQELRDILDDIVGDLEPLIIIRSGTPFGMLFLESVTDESLSQTGAAPSAPGVIQPIIGNVPINAGTPPGSGVNIGAVPGTAP